MTAEPLADRSPSGRKIRSLRAPSRARLLFLTRKYALKWAACDLARLFLWTPVAVAVGAGFYFALKSEPPWQAGFAFLLISLAAAIRSI